MIIDIAKRIIYIKYNFKDYCRFFRVKLAPARTEARSSEAQGDFSWGDGSSKATRKPFPRRSRPCPRSTPFVPFTTAHVAGIHASVKKPNGVPVHSSSGQ